jgi:hypothetical protein
MNKNIRYALVSLVLCITCISVPAADTAHLYRSYPHSANEKTNGLLRQFFPKGTDFDEISGV